VPPPRNPSWYVAYTIKLSFTLYETLTIGSVFEESATTNVGGAKPQQALPARSNRSCRISLSSLLFLTPTVRDTFFVSCVTVLRKMPVFSVVCVSTRSMHDVPSKHGYKTEMFEFKSSALK